MRLAQKTLLIACLAAAALGGCGGGSDESKQIPAATRQQLEEQLASVENRLDSGGGACSDIAANQSSIDQTLGSLSRDVDPDVRQALRDGFDRLFQLTAEQCDEQKGQETDTTESAPAPLPQTETTPPETTPTEPQQTEEQPQEEPKKDKGNGGKKGNGNGDGAGGVVPQTGGDGGGTVSP